MFISRTTSILYSVLSNYLDHFRHNALKFPSKLADGFSVTFWNSKCTCQYICNYFCNMFSEQTTTTKKSKEKTKSNL